MNLELLDELEDKVDVTVNAINQLRLENEALKNEAKDLDEKVRSLSADLQAAGASQNEASELRAKCEDLESRLGNVRGRIQGMVEKMKALEA
jgi:FtsZ-binding cell division protein ZapB